MPGGGQINVQNNQYGMSTNIGSGDPALEILSMQDIDRMSRELILPSLNMTKSSSFIPNQFSSPLDNNHANGGGYANKGGMKDLISDSPYA